MYRDVYVAVAAGGKENEIQDKLTSKAREIREILSITNQKEFDKNTLEQNINQNKYLHLGVVMVYK